MGRPKVERDKVRGKRLGELIKESGRTQQGFADELHISKQHLNSIIQGNKNLTYDLAADAIQFFPGINLNWLLNKSDIKSVTEKEEAVRIQTAVNNLMDRNELVEQLIQRHGYEISEETDVNGKLQIAIKSPGNTIRYLRPKEYMSFLKMINNLLEGQLLLMMSKAIETVN